MSIQQGGREANQVRELLIAGLSMMLENSPRTVTVQFADGDYQDIHPDVFRLLLSDPPTPTVKEPPRTVTSDRAKEACSAPGKQGQGREWQPIETAPRDCTDVLLHYDGRAPVVAAWFRGGWAPMDLDGRHLSAGQPTCWMPLPPPPIDSQGEKP